MKMVEVKNLSVVFGDFYAVKNISFSVEKGEIFGFLGANGAGKTTTIRVLCGLLIPTEGEATIAGLSVEKESNRVKSKLGYMSQKFTLYDELSIEENLEFAASLRKIPKQEYIKRRDEILNFIEFNKSLKTIVKDLPGGIKQQMSLAASIIGNPEIIFLDEPTAGVTPVSRELFWKLIRKLAAQNKTIFVTTHYMDEAENCDRIALMRSGEIIALDNPLKLKENTFPDGIFELEPKKNINMDFDFNKYSKIFTSQPYGLKFHAIVKDASSWINIQDELNKYFIINKLKPTMEDVFIELVEGQNR